MGPIQSSYLPDETIRVYRHIMTIDFGAEGVASNPVMAPLGSFEYTGLLVPTLDLFHFI